MEGEGGGRGEGKGRGRSRRSSRMWCCVEIEDLYNNHNIVPGSATRFSLWLVVLCGLLSVENMMYSTYRLLAPARVPVAWTLPEGTRRPAVNYEEKPRLVGCKTVCGRKKWMEECKSV